MKSRKFERKKARKEKKIKKSLYYFHKNNSKTTEEEDIKDIEKCEKIIKTENKPKIKINKKNEKKKNIEKNIEKNVEKNVKKLSFKQKRDIEKEEKEIKRLEKLLKLNRRKRKGKKVTTLPKSFKTEGLDYILDVIDSQKMDQNSDNEESVLEEDKHMADVESDSNFSTDNQSDEDQEEDQLEDEGQEDEEVFDGSDEVSVSSDSEIEETEQTNELKEDIYGFIRDSSGNIIKTKSDSKQEFVNKESGSVINPQLLRRIRGSLNRLTVNNLMTISGQMTELFGEFSRYSVTEGLFSCINNSLIDLEYMSPPKMKTEAALLVSILHNMVGDEVGGHVIHSCISKLDEFIKDLSESKKIDNLLLFIINLYVCGLIESLLVFEIMSKLCDQFNEKTIELINLILKSVGFVLRKDNAIQMKQFIIRIQNEAKSVDKTSLSGNRITFLLESLIAIKNNNMTKLKGYGTEVDVQLIETTLKSTIKKSRVNSISGAYDAVLQSSHWYSFTQNFETINSIEEKFETKVENQINERLFKALRLNTPLRKSIVMSLSTCNDYIDAANRLISIGKKQFSEVINVLLHVCIHEKHFNPFYSHLFQHLSQCDRKYRVSLK